VKADLVVGPSAAVRAGDQSAASSACRADRRVGVKMGAGRRARLAQFGTLIGNSGEPQASSGTSKTLMNLVFSETLNDIKAAKMASQALDEGSIPFTRSK
jgi:hypothetical protein